VIRGRELQLPLAIPPPDRRPPGDQECPRRQVAKSHARWEVGEAPDSSKRRLERSRVIQRGIAYRKRPGAGAGPPAFSLKAAPKRPVDSGSGIVAGEIAVKLFE
jgi:hypothetical protein